MWTEGKFLCLLSHLYLTESVNFIYMYEREGKIQQHQLIKHDLALVDAGVSQ